MLGLEEKDRKVVVMDPYERIGLLSTDPRFSHLEVPLLAEFMDAFLAGAPRVCGYVYLWGDVCGQSYGRNTAHYGAGNQFHDVIPAALVRLEDTDE